MNSGFESQGSGKTLPERTLTPVEEVERWHLEEDGAEEGGSVPAEAFLLWVEGDGEGSEFFRVDGRRTIGFWSGGLEAVVLVRFVVLEGVVGGDGGGEGGDGGGEGGGDGGGLAEEKEGGVAGVSVFFLKNRRVVLRPILRVWCLGRREKGYCFGLAWV